MKNEQCANAPTHEQKLYVAGTESLFLIMLSGLNPVFTAGGMLMLAEMMRQLHLHLKDHPEDKRYLSGTA